MKIQDLKVGMEFKSYKALCEFLGEPVKGGDSKKAQLKKWEEHFTWSNIGNKFVISTIKVDCSDSYLSPTQIDIKGDKQKSKVDCSEITEVIEGNEYKMSELVQYFLNEDVAKGGDKYTRQRAMVECHARIVYQNGKWFVKEIYDIEIEREDGRSGRCIFNPNGDINKILSLYFWLVLKSTNERAMTISIPKLEMLCLLGLTNNNFKHLRYENDGLEKLGYNDAQMLMRDIQSWGEGKIGTLCNQLIKKGVIGASQINWRTLVLQDDNGGYINVIANNAQVNELELFEDEAIKIWNATILDNIERRQLFSFKDVKFLCDEQKTQFYGILNNLIKTNGKSLPSNYAYNYKCYNFLTNEVKLEKALKKFGVNVKELQLEDIEQLMYQEITNVNNKHIEIQLKRFFDTLTKAQAKELSNAELEEYNKKRIKRLGEKAPVQQDLTKMEQYALKSFENIERLISLLLNNQHETTEQEQKVIEYNMNRWNKRKQIVIEMEE